MRFEILGEISDVETIATGSRIREIPRLRRVYGRGRWRKRKGVARIQLTDGSVHVVEISRRDRTQGIQDKAPALKAQEMSKAFSKQFVVCVDNEGYEVSLEKRKIYVALRDAAAEKQSLMRVIDESGDDYLYPKTFFRSIALPESLKKAVLAAA